MSNQVAIIIAGALIAAAIMVTNHWQIVSPATVKLDRWTGDAYLCGANSDRKLNCP